MIAVSGADDFEMFSSTGLGAIQGFGYQYHAAGTTGYESIVPCEQF